MRKITAPIYYQHIRHYFKSEIITAIRLQLALYKIPFRIIDDIELKDSDYYISTFFDSQFRFEASEVHEKLNSLVAKVSQVLSLITCETNTVNSVIIGRTKSVLEEDMYFVKFELNKDTLDLFKLNFENF